MWRSEPLVVTDTVLGHLSFLSALSRPLPPTLPIPPCMRSRSFFSLLSIDPFLQMATTLMQPSQDEIQREVENLRDIKRRSTLQGGPGALVIDPDLPTPGAQAAAAQASYWNPSDDSSSSDSHSHEDTSGDDSASDDPLHLFWVPANMHPEIDPGQFRAFLKEHARTPAEATLGRSESLSSASLGRKKSMLSRQYRPSENDGVEDERVVPLRRNRSSLYATSGPQLTIKDLEKLDELVEEASQSRDPSKLRTVLRRSLSMNMSPSGAWPCHSCCIH